MTYCHACGMPLERAEDRAGGEEHATFCVHCVREDGSVRSCEEIFEGGVQFFLGAIGGERDTAERVTRKNMRMQPYWQGKNCPVLEGEEASDVEFAAAMQKLG